MADGCPVFKGRWHLIDNPTVACVDVYYYKDYARACCIVFTLNEEKIISKYVELVKGIEDYVSGQFYKRELPCILKVLEKVKENIDMIITDSFVAVDEHTNGLGAYLYESLNYEIPVIGVAKSFLKGNGDYIEVHRGKSINPLYVSSIGIDLDYAGGIILNLKGDYRIPDILKQVDKMSRDKNDLHNKIRGAD